MEKTRKNTIAIIINAITVMIVAVILFYNGISVGNSIAFLLIVAFLFSPHYMPFINKKAKEIQPDEGE